MVVVRCGSPCLSRCVVRLLSSRPVRCWRSRPVRVRLRTAARELGRQRRPWVLAQSRQHGYDEPERDLRCHLRSEEEGLWKFQGLYLRGETDGVKSRRPAVPPGPLRAQAHDAGVCVRAGAVPARRVQGDRLSVCDERRRRLQGHRDRRGLALRRRRRRRQLGEESRASMSTRRA